MKRLSPFIRQARRGFTLLELAIVLLLVTALVGAIMTAAERLWDNYRIYRVVQQVMNSVQNIRDNFSNSISAFPSTTEQTNSFDSLGLLPVEMRRYPSLGPGNTPMDHALNNDYSCGVKCGSFRVFTINNVVTGSTNTAFRIVLFGISQAACIKLLMATPLADGSIGILQIGTGASSGTLTATNMPSSTSAIIYNGAQGSSGSAAYTAYTMSMTTAQAWCNTSTTTDVDLDFKLHN